MSTLKPIANFLYEVGMLNKTPRSGFHFLGSGEQSVAEHTCRTVYISYVLGMLDGTVDVGRMLKMALLHDLGESRVSDLNHVHQKYAARRQSEAVGDVAATLPFGADIVTACAEQEAKQTPEAVLVKDADTLEWIISLKEQVDIGNERARYWIDYATRKLKTDIARQLAAEMMQTDSNEWWGGEAGGKAWQPDQNLR
ncbi:MAG: HD domain-containing protein [Candidatus Magasanikbacteria bacterium]|nr:HD domain-containing protein [Candidatus Magasanikbacteria bacterium]